MKRMEDKIKNSAKSEGNDLHKKKAQTNKQPQPEQPEKNSKTRIGDTKVSKKYDQVEGWNEGSLE